MEEPAIEILNVSKVYKLYDKPIDRLKEVLSPTKKSYHRDFYALKHINLTVRRGETVGLIGKNGAGKSTLLKIITGVASPTTGSVKLHGRVSSLLELGAGFNPEYTGLENIYLHGAFLGMTREEIDARRETILDFAEIGDFIHQPVKNYSSGMYVRLAFSVAINVDPDILIVDEALAVGDAKFQLKCFSRLKEMKEKGVTIVFVSHAIDQIRYFCTKGILMDHGTILYEGDPKEAGARYFDLIFPKQDKNQDVHKDIVESVQGSSIIRDAYYLYPEKDHDVQRFHKYGEGGARIDWVKIVGTNGKNIVVGGETLEITFCYTWDSEFLQEQQLTHQLENDVGISIAWADEKGDYLFGCNNFDAQVPVHAFDKNTVVARFRFKLPFLKTGAYFITSAITFGTQQKHIPLCWYDYFAEFRCVSCKENVYGAIHLEYAFEILEGEESEKYP